MVGTCNARAVAKHATVDEYIAALPEPLAVLAQRARKVIDANLKEADSAIRWAHPTWSLGKTPICYLKVASKHITFGFWHGASIDDPSGRLESSGNVMAHVKLRTQGDIDPTVFADWLKQAEAIEASLASESRSGSAVKRAHVRGRR